MLSVPVRGKIPTEEYKGHRPSFDSDPAEPDKGWKPPLWYSELPGQGGDVTSFSAHLSARLPGVMFVRTSDTVSF